MSVTHFKDVDENVNLQEIVLNPKNASDSNVYLFAEKELVVKMQTVKLETTVLNVHVHLISLVMAILDVTLNVQNTTIALETKHASNSNVEIHAENPIQTYVVKEQTVKSKTTNLFAHAQEDTPVIHSEAAVSSQEKIFVNQILAEMERNASLVTIVVDQTDQFVPAHLEPEETHWENVPRVNVNMTMNVEVNEPVTTSDAQIPVPMHVVKGLNAEHVIMAQFARVQEVILEIPQLPVVPIEIVEVVDLAVNAEPAMSLESLDIEDSSTITSHHFTRITQSSKIVPYSQIEQSHV